MNGGLRVMLDPLVDKVPGDLDGILAEVTQSVVEAGTQVCNIVSVR